MTLGLKFQTSVINNLIADTSTYLWRVGSVRLHFEDFTQGNMALFNLSNANSGTGYPLLDSIDYTFYREYGFQITEKRYPELISNHQYRSFKDTMCSLYKSVDQKRQYLWLDSNRELREKLLLSRYTINDQPITLNRKLKRKVTADFKNTATADLNKILKIAAAAKDSTTSQKADSVSLNLYFSRFIDRTLDIKGSFLTITFQEEYITRIHYIISNLPQNARIVMENNEFTNNLLKYVDSLRGSEFAFNSAMFAFRFRGGLSRTSISVDSVKSDLMALFNIGSQIAGSIATHAAFLFSKHVDETFSNQFSKVWLIMFGTDDRLNKLAFSNSTRTGPGTARKRKKSATSAGSIAANVTQP